MGARGPKARPLLDRFEEKYCPEPNTGCWLWTGSTNPSGYGQLFRSWRKGSRPALAHRIAWELFNGPIPDSIFVCHRCDTPSCVNPKHLFLGTCSDNMQDCSKKGRLRIPALRGEAQPTSKLTVDQVAVSYTHLRAHETPEHL